MGGGLSGDVVMPFSARSSTKDVLAGLDLRGRVVLVTGATSGIGFETARALAEAGARVHVGGRDDASAGRAVSAIRARHPAADVRPFAVDLASLRDCVRAAAALAEPRLHAVIANAGLVDASFHETVDGLERTVAVCHYGHAALVRGLVDKLIAAAPSRLVMVASGSHRGERALDPAHVSMDRGAFTMLGAYNRAKLCNVLYANAFDRRYKERGVRANSLHPGTLIPTGISRGSFLAKLGILLHRPFAKTLGQGAATTVLAAVHPSLDGVGGAYLEDCGLGRASDAGRDDALADRLWDETAALLERAG